MPIFSDLSLKHPRQKSALSWGSWPDIDLETNTEPALKAPQWETILMESFLLLDLAPASLAKF